MFVSGVTLFDASTCEAVDVTVNRQKLVELFDQSDNLRTNAAILHYAVLQARDVALVREVSCRLEM